MARRFFDLLPRYLKTKHNDRSTAIAEDVMYDPEDFEPVEGYIGDAMLLEQEELERNPKIPEINEERSSYQLSVSVVSGESESDVVAGAFYNDIIGQLRSNNADIDNHSRIFSSSYFEWCPPIDIDRWTNFHRYVWTGEGDAKLNGEYVTKDPAGSRTVLWRVDSSSTITRVVVQQSAVEVGSFTNGTAIGDLKEDCTDPNRRIYRWNGSIWSIINWTPIADVPQPSPAYLVGTYFYVARSTYLHQRPLLYQYSSSVKKWTPKLPVISITPPESPFVGTLWEDCRTSPNRPIYRYTSNSTWVPVSWISARASMVNAGHESDGDFIFHAQDIVNVTDGWSKNNWWKHFDDLSSVDKASLPVLAVGMRPILQLWGGIERYGSNNRTTRNSQPKFNIYASDPDDKAQIVQINSTNFDVDNSIDNNQGCTILQYAVGAGNSDPVLGFPGSFDDNGEFRFDTTLVTMDIQSDGNAVNGYRYFKDTFTGSLRSIWLKSNGQLGQTQLTGVWSLPRNLTDNPDHDVPGVFSRSDVLHHFASIIDVNASGENSGSNGYRWVKDTLNGSKIIDPESSLLKTMSLLLSNDLDVPFCIRTMSYEYSRFCRRFIKKVDEIWDSGEYTKPDNTLKSGFVTADIVDAALSAIFVGKTSDGPFWHSDMGLYDNIDLDSTFPITIPPTPARIGAVQTYQPRKFTMLGTDYLLSHDGRIIKAWGDGRDDVWINLEQRFFNKVPANRRDATTENIVFGADQWILRKYVGNRIFEFDQSVEEVVDDAISEPDPGIDGYKVFSQEHGSYAIWTNAGWAFFKASPDEIFYNSDDSRKYCFNGLTATAINEYNRAHSFDYEIKELDNVIRSEFSRWTIARGIDAALNDTFDANNPFTWNYSSAGIEGNWKGIYRRIYGTYRPHMCPWEIFGFSIEPTWWRTVYAPTSVAADGSPRYSSTHTMWADLRAGGTLMPMTIQSWQKPNTSFPIPVDLSGELLDPISAGIVSNDAVPVSRRSDRWKFGDYSPAEASFWESPEGRYTESLVGYLLKPAIFVETLWSDHVISVGDGQLVDGPIIVDSDELKRTKVSTFPVHGELVNGEFYENVGLVSWIGERLVMIGADIGSTFGDLVRRSRPVLGWRTGGFILRSRTSVRTQTGVVIPETDVSVVIHESKPRKVFFHSGVVIVRDGTGYRVYGYDNANPYFTVMPGARPVIGGQVFLRESFTSAEGQTEFVLETLRFNSTDISVINVLIDGIKIDSARYVTLTPPNKVTVNYPLLDGQNIVVVQNTTQTSPSTRTRTFSVNGIVFYYYPTALGTTNTYSYGHRFESNQDVVEFLYDYGRWLKSEGWVYGTEEEPETAKNDWLAVASRFAEWSIIGRNDGDIFIDVASGRSLTLSIAHGNAMDVESFVDGGYSIVDMGGFPIKPNETVIGRSNGRMTIECQNKEIFGIRVRVNDIEHAMYLSNTTRFDDVIYRPLYALKRDNLLVKTYRTRNWNGRYEAPGYVFVGQNIFPNFEKQVYDITRFYNTTNPVGDAKTLEHGWNLYGWRKRQYISNMGVSLPTSFDYNRGLSRYKGTKDAFTAFVLGLTRGSDGNKISENWAWKVAEFGFNGSRIRARFSLYSEEVKDKIQIIKFTDEESDQDTTIEVLPFNRLTGIGDARWILPPTLDNDTNLSFPLSSNRPDVDKHVYKMSIVPTNPIAPDTFSPIRFFHWDPAAGLHSPYALAQVDIISSSDPARYNQGPEKNREPGAEWAAEHVGTIWWDTSNLGYHQYWNETTDRKKSIEWGKTSRLKVTAQVVNDTNITITTESAHGLIVDDGIILYGSDGKRYSATVMEVVDADSVDIVANFGGDPDPVFLLPSDIPTFVEMRTRDVEVYEWVKSRFTPASYKSTFGTVRNSQDPSYVEEVLSDGTVNYYFWVRNRPTLAKNKTMSSLMIEEELRDPSKFGRNWFAPISNDAFIFNSESVGSNDNTSIEIFVDSNTTDVHAEWALVRSGHEITRVNGAVRNKIISCLLGVDENGTSIPSNFLTDEEKYGSLRGQTIFRDLTEARNVAARSLTRMLCSFNPHEQPEFLTLFPNADEGVWYKASNFILDGYESILATVTVADLTELNSISIKQEGDLVKVLFADTHPYYASQSSAHYIYLDGEWVRFRFEGYGIEILTSIFTISGARSKLESIFSFLSPLQESQVIDCLIREMLAQNINCDWCYMTSLFDLTHTVRVWQPSYRPMDEVPILLSAISEIKPYHSKIRDLSIIGQVDVDQFVTDVKDPYTFNITEYVDRLSTNGLQDFGWDSDPWQFRQWDLQPHFMSDLGQSSWEVIGTFVSNNNTNQVEFNIPGPANPLFNLRLTVVDQNGITQPSPQCELKINQDFSVTAKFVAKPPVGVILQVEQSLGLRDGSIPQLPSSVLNEYPWMQPSESSRAHAVIRSQEKIIPPSRTVIGDSEFFGDPEDETGGNPGERILLEPIDGFSMYVETDGTEAYSSWDSTPFDMSTWDFIQEELPTTRFYIVSGFGSQLPINPSLVDNLTYTEEVVTDATTEQKSGVVGSANNTRYTVTAVELKVDGSTQFNAVDPSDYQILANNSVKFNKLTSTVYEYAPAFMNMSRPIKQIRYRSTILTPGVDYTLTSNKLQATIINYIGMRLTVDFIVPSDDNNTIRLTYGKYRLKVIPSRASTSSEINFEINRLTGVLDVNSSDVGATYDINYMDDVTIGLQPISIVPGGGRVFDRYFESSPPSGTYIGFTRIGNASSVGTWSGSAYTYSNNILPNTTYFLKSGLDAYRWDGSDWTVVTDADDPTERPFIDTYDRGITASTIFYGMDNDSASSSATSAEAVIGPIPSTINLTDILIWSGSHLGWVPDVNDRIVGLNNVVASYSFGQTSSSYRPYHDPDIRFDSGDLMHMSVSHASINNLWSGGATIIFFANPSSPGGTILSKRGLSGNGWEITDDASSIRFTQKFSGSTATWVTNETYSGKVCEITYNSSTLSAPVIKLNGVVATLTQGVAPSGSVVSDSSSSLFLGIKENSLADPYDGLIFELIMFTRSLTSDESDEMYSLLLNRWD